MVIGSNHTCALTPAGGVKCWGKDTNGQLGNDLALTDKSTPVDVLGLTSGVVSISAGQAHTCAVTTAGGAKCWGSDEQGQVGDNVSMVTSQPVPVDVLGLTSGVASISAGGFHTCAVHNGAAKCWGSANGGQLGAGGAVTGQASKGVPQSVLNLTSGVASISAGGNTSCAVTTTGGAKCWGSDSKGQLGNNATRADVSSPQDVYGLTTGVASISVGLGHTCAVTAAGAAMCWGSDFTGQLGNGSVETTDKYTPWNVLGLSSGVASISAGDGTTCAVTTSGAAKCWGSDDYGQLGNDSLLVTQPSPVDVFGLSSGVLSISTNRKTTCAVTAGGIAKCWGSDLLGQLGDDAVLASKSAPVYVSP